MQKKEKENLVFKVLYIVYTVRLELICARNIGNQLPTTAYSNLTSHDRLPGLRRVPRVPALLTQLNCLPQALVAGHTYN